MVKRSIQQISMSLPSNLRASDLELSNGWWRYHTVVVCWAHSQGSQLEKKKDRKKNLNRYTSRKCIKSPHSQLCLEAAAWRMQGWSQAPPAPSTACPYSEDFKAHGVCDGHLLRGFFCSWVLELARVTWCYSGGGPGCVLAAGKAIQSSVQESPCSEGVFCPFWTVMWQHNKMGLGSGLELLKPCLH